MNAEIQNAPALGGTTCQLSGLIAFIFCFSSFSSYQTNTERDG